MGYGNFKQYKILLDIINQIVIYLKKLNNFWWNQQWLINGKESIDLNNFWWNQQWLTSNKRLFYFSKKRYKRHNCA